MPVEKAYIVVTHYWEEDRYLQRGKSFDGFATPQDAMARLMEEAAKGFVFAYAICLDEDMFRNQVWSLTWEPTRERA